jgi:hypothetical protein
VKSILSDTKKPVVMANKTYLGSIGWKSVSELFFPLWLINLKGCFVSVSRITYNSIGDDIQPRRAICEVISDESIDEGHVEIGTTSLYSLFYLTG